MIIFLSILFFSVLIYGVIYGFREHLDAFEIFLNFMLFLIFDTVLCLIIVFLIGLFQVLLVNL